MKHYIMGILGGVLAILAAFGWTVTLALMIAIKFGTPNTGYDIPSIAKANGPLLWVISFLIFAAGFFLGFRKVY